MTETDLEAKVIELLTRFENINIYLGNETGLGTLDPIETKLHEYINFERKIVDEDLSNDLSKNPGLFKLVKDRLRKSQPLEGVELQKILGVTEIYLAKIRGGRILFKLILKLKLKDRVYKKYFCTVPLRDNSVFSPEFKDKLIKYLELNRVLDKRIKKAATSITDLDSIEKIRKMFCQNKDITISDVRITDLGVDINHANNQTDNTPVDNNNQTDNIPFDFISIKNKKEILGMLKKNKVS